MFPVEHMQECESQVQTHERQVIFELLVKHSPFLMSVLYSNYSPQPDMDLEDLFQDFIVSLAETKLPPNVRCVESFFVRALKNDIKDRHRRAKNFQEHIHNPLYFHKLQYRLKRDEPTALIEYKDTLEHIIRIIKQSLPEHEAHAVRQKLLMEGNVAESAERLNIKKRSFSRYLCTGLKRLRKLLPDLEYVS